MKILMVCLGNICRSPLAEGILSAKLEKKGLNWEVDSAGTNGYHIGEAPHPLSQKVARENGIDISTQQCRRFVKEDMQRFDRIYVMDQENYEAVKSISGNAWEPEKAALILNHLYSGKNREVPDPWYGTEKDFHLVFDMLSKACDRILEEYKKAI